MCAISCITHEIPHSVYLCDGGGHKRGPKLRRHNKPQRKPHQLARRALPRSCGEENGTSEVDCGSEHTSKIRHRVRRELPSEERRLMDMRHLKRQACSRYGVAVLSVVGAALLTSAIAPLFTYRAPVIPFPLPCMLPACDGG